MTYIEPFVGGGSIFFYKNESKVEIISDIDKNVIVCFKGFKTYSGSKIESVANGDYDKDKFEKIKACEPTDKFEKFIRILLLYKLSFYSKGKSFGNTHRVGMNIGNKYKDRLRKTTILNKDYQYVIEKYDGCNSFFYLDPPYMGSTSSHYENHYFDIHHLYDILRNIRGKFLLSFNYDSDVCKLFKDFNIYKIKTKYTDPFNGGQPRSIVEILICNY